MADDTKVPPVTTDSVAAKADAAKANQSVSDFLSTHDDAEMQKAIERSNNAIKVGSTMARKHAGDAIAEMSERDTTAKQAAQDAMDEIDFGSDRNLPHEVYRAREIARIKAEARAKKIDETVPGGRYFEGGKWVDCDGRQVD